MKFLFSFFLIFFAFFILLGQSSETENSKYVIVLHGGAGYFNENTPKEVQAKYEEAMRSALLKGYEKIKEGESSLDAVTAVINILEDYPLFNAGRGSVLTNEGKVEMDASIMYGKTLEAGAVAGVTTIKNPVSAARAVMEKSGHVMLSGKGADQFAKEMGLETEDPSYFIVKDKLTKYEESHKTENNLVNETLSYPDEKFGTVGCVALDKDGNLSAGTSTGGMSNKKFGRIGDSPIIGAGTYANNETAGISCTGWGEYFIRSGVALTVSHLIEFKNLSLNEAAETALERMTKLGGDGGIIALNTKGEVSMVFNTKSMFRATITEDGKIEVFIYK